MSAQIWVFLVEKFRSGRGARVNLYLKIISIICISIWIDALLVYGLLLIEASVQPTHKYTKTLTPKTLCILFNWEIRFVFVWLSNHPKCRFGNHIQVVGVSWEKKPLSLMFKVKIIRNFSSIIRAENERDTWFYEIQLFTIMRDSSVHQDLLINSNQIKSIVSIPNLDDFSKYSHVQYFPLFCSHSIRLAWLFFSSSL